ncbi:lysozyme family protein [Allosalinactinospora lopnorensis]|uniref:lytic murein transglycosylase n=1 Tax=Allosalinactinospora lopnorensis TaxID=1352348 RepID=UPI000A9FA2DE|nr:lytic murein transglycosylase [Allosalinactinospora lopnorensis]
MSPPAVTERDAPTGGGAPPSTRKLALTAAAAVLATIALAGGVAGLVAGTQDSAAPPQLPPGPLDNGGVVDTVPAEEQDEAAEGEPRPDNRPSPESRREAYARPSPEWLDRIAADTGIPHRALQGYAAAQLRIMEEEPDCLISWPTLAGIGEVESHHGAFTGGEIGSDGRTTEDIIGIPLDGNNGTAAVPDTDNGELDGDPVWDRAVGPMQFIPGTWEQWGASATGGEPDPHHIDDAALTTARYLCADGRDMTDDDDWWAAILTYNESRSYAEDVLARANEYVAGAG